MLLFVFVACTHPVDPPTLGVPVAPVGGSVGRSTFGVGMRMPPEADPELPWTASDPRVTCEGVGEVLNVRFEVASAAEWPYRLPAAFTCAQDDVTVAIPVAFTPPSAPPRIAADGTFVVPRRAGAVQSACDAAPGLVRAALEPPAAGVTCHVAGGSLCVDVAPDVGPGEHTCVVTRADGTPEGRRVAIVAY
jgi:hypothetical protein